MADLQTLGRHKLQRRIASSATGEVYEALDPKLERPVAIKTILKSYLNEEASREYSARFKEEAQAVARRGRDCMPAFAPRALCRRPPRPSEESPSCLAPLSLPTVGPTPA